MIRACCLIAGCSLLLLAAGCGGGGSGGQSGSEPAVADSETPEVEPPTREEWAAQADAVCARTISALNKLPQPTSLQELAELMQEGARLFARAVDEIRGLDAPPDDQPAIDEMVQAFADSGKVMQEVRAAALSEDPEAVEAALAEDEEPALRAGELAFELGLEQCSVAQPG